MDISSLTPDKQVKLDPYHNSLFLFCVRRAERIKTVRYEGDGFCLLYKQYESGHLKPRTVEEAKQISFQHLRWLLKGLNPEQPEAVQK